jgi:hypothetical protein
MYRNRKEACDELVRMFKAKEPLLLFIWTKESIRAACNSMHPSDQETEQLMLQAGSLSMADYQRDGFSHETVRTLLARIREDATRTVPVPADVLQRLIARHEAELVHQEGLAWEEGHPTPVSIKRAMQDVETIKTLMAA